MKYTTNVDNSRVKFYCDDNRCISCFGCVTACKNAHEVPVGVNRRRVITLDDGIEGKERSISIACMHCTDAPCAQVCPVNCFYIREDGIVLHDKNECIGCGYCLFACPFGAPQFPKSGLFGGRGVMDKCTYCAGGPSETFSEDEFTKYGQNRIAEGLPPMCASMCSTKALLAGDSNSISNIVANRALTKSLNASNASSSFNIWKVAYKD